jgi:hypothetical protein
MNSPILRHNGPHKVEVAEGSKDASRRQALDKNALNTPQTAGSLSHLSLKQIDDFGQPSQLVASAADTSDVWTDDETFSARLDQLRASNQQMTQRLKQISPSASREDRHE